MKDEIPSNARFVDEIFSTRGAALFVHRSERTLQGWRNRNQGPPYIKLNASTVLYRKSDLEKFLASKTVTPQADSTEDAAA